VAKRKSTFSRREFFISAAGTAAVIGVGCSAEKPNADGQQSASGGNTTTAAGGSGQGGSTGGTGAPDAGSGGSGGTDAAVATALVGLARAASVGESVRQAIALTSGLGFIRSGDTVLLKPNLNSGDPFPYSTNPEVVRAVIELARDHGASRVIVADRSNPSYDTIDAMQRSGISAVAEALGAEIMNLSGQQTTRVTPAGASHWPDGFETYSLLLGDVDHIINLPACKHHSLANFSMALKAWMGIIVQDDRLTAHSDLGNRLPELHLAVASSFTVLDATKAVLTRGPMPGGEQSSPGLVVATADPIACDATGVAILKHELQKAGISNGAIDNFSVWQQPQLVRALDLGIGIQSPSQYVATASGVDEFDTLMQYTRA
jgi:uncharacterized protein (DUF362 family)